MGRVNAGDFRERVTLLTPPAKVSDNGGGWLPAAGETSRTVYAEVVPGKGGERLRQAGIQAMMPYELRVRWEARPLTAERLLWRGITMKIHAVQGDPNREFWTVYAYDAHG